MVCQECLEKRERTSKQGFSHSKRNLNDNFLSLNAARKVGVNMHLEHKKFGFDPMSIKCNICKGRVENNNLYCLQCAFSKGICESCGKRISDVKMYKQSDIDYKKLKKIKEADRQKQAQKKQEAKINLEHGVNREEKRNGSLNIQRTNPTLKLKRVKEKIDQEQENSEDEIDFTKNIDEICNEKTKIYNEKIEEVDGHGKSNERKKSDDNKKEKEQDEVELDEDYTEIIKI